MRAPPPLLYAFLLIILYELEDNIMFPPTIRLLENAICQQHFAALPSGQIVVPVPESMCKTEAVQSRLAYVRGWLSLLKTAPGSSFSFPLSLFFSPFSFLRNQILVADVWVDEYIAVLLGAGFGSLADQYGRRPIYALAIFGMLCLLGSTYLICKLSSKASIYPLLDLGAVNPR
jgi:hypothetical protein